MIGEIAALIAAVLWSLHVIFARKAQHKNSLSANPLDPMVGLFLTIFANNVINVVVLSVRYIFWPPQPAPVYAAGVIAIAVVGVSNSFVGRGLLFVCVGILGAAKTGLTRATMPVFVVLGGVLVLGERFSPQAWIGMSVVFLSLFLVSLDTVRRDKSSGAALQDSAKERADRLRLMKGIAIGLGAAMIMGSGSIVRKAGVDILSDTFLAVSIDAFAALIACVTVLLIRGKGREMIRAVKNIEFNYTMSGVFASAGLYSMVYSLSLTPVAITNSITATEPLFTIIIVWLMNEGKKEKLGIQTLLFGIMMVAGTIILITSRV
ncbi:MAG: DMT family transporter [Treponema sp.]|nr:DMT family transporter [Treponema sp.]